MSLNTNGIINCPRGEERFESFRMGRRTYVQYDYRNLRGELFTCVRETLAKCRAARATWELARVGA